MNTEVKAVGLQINWSSNLDDESRTKFGSSSAYYSNTAMGIIPMRTKVVKQWLVACENGLWPNSYA